MGESRSLHRFGYRAMFLAIAALVVFIRILPVDLGWSRLPTPDILLLLTFAWVVRRPDYVPVWMVAGLALFADVIFVRPLGLWALLTVLGSEVLRRRGRALAAEGLAFEWLIVAATLLAMTLARILVLALTLVPQPPLGTLALEFVVSVFAYPLVALVTAFGAGVRHAGPADRKAEGRP